LEKKGYLGRRLIEEHPREGSPSWKEKGKHKDESPKDDKGKE
jgi:hypothetical protein